MRTHWLPRVLMNVALCLAACSSSPPPQDPAPPDPELTALKERAEALKSRAMQQAPTADLVPEAQRLAKDVSAWQGRTGRNDVRVEDKKTSVTKETGGGGDDCPPCPPLDTSGIAKGEICYLAADLGCLEHIKTICLYTCIVIATPPNANQ